MPVQMDATPTHKVIAMVHNLRSQEMVTLAAGNRAQPSAGSKGIFKDSVLNNPLNIINLWTVSTSLTFKDLMTTDLMFNLHPKGPTGPNNEVLGFGMVVMSVRTWETL